MGSLKGFNVAVESNQNVLSKLIIYLKQQKLLSVSILMHEKEVEKLIWWKYPFCMRLFLRYILNVI